MVDEGEATFDGVEVEGRDRVPAGALLRAQPPQSFRLLPEDIPLSVIYEDDDLAVVDKAAGMVVHPGAGNDSGTMAAAILHRWPEIEGVGDKDRWGIVHRLDRETSGVLIVAKRAESFDELKQALAERRIRRAYWALAEGGFGIETGTIDAPIARDPARPTRFAVAPQGRPAITHYRRLAEWEGLTLLEVELETGRTHQIRVHLSSIGHPLSGDVAYGAKRSDGPPRVWLHAARLAVPRGDEVIEASAPLPDDLSRDLDQLGAPLVGVVEIG